MFLSKLFVVTAILMVGWLRMPTADAFGISSFGKANTEPPKPATTTASPARSCSHQTECAGISGSSCVRTPYDSTTRCLCGDNSPPVNGQCESQTKSLFHVCSNSNDCNDNMICGVPNITATAPRHLRVHSPQEKICLCDPDSDVKEKDYSCNDAEILKTSLFAIIIVSFLRKLF